MASAAALRSFWPLAAPSVPRRVCNPDHSAAGVLRPPFILSKYLPRMDGPRCDVCGNRLVRLDRTSALAGRPVYTHRDAGVRDHAPQPEPAAGADEQLS
jgi:hypothetical protein